MTPSPPTPLPSLRPEEVHLWLVEPERVSEPRLLDTYRDLLDGEERQRLARFRFERHRLQFLVSHVLVRVTLSRYASVAPEAWSFVTNAYGRPEVAEGLPRLRFNLSHTDGMAVCAVTPEADVGVDVEDGERSGQTVELAETVFAPSEVTALKALPVEHQRERFFTYWTLKEAYIKARGMGLSLPLAQFAFQLEPERSPRIVFDSRLADDPDTWRFVQVRPSARHQVALAVRRDSRLPLRVRCQRTVPLLEDEAPWFVSAG
jgi:4'-phosphopantetheinyl transferase